MFSIIHIKYDHPRQILIPSVNRALIFAYFIFPFAGIVDINPTLVLEYLHLVYFCVFLLVSQLMINTSWVELSVLEQGKQKKKCRTKDRARVGNM